jgi:hypothetical protein
VNPRIEERDGSVFTHYDDFTIEYRDASHRYWIIKGGERSTATSVTSALKVLAKDALVGWAEGVGAEGAARLAKLGKLDDVPVDRAIDLVRAHGLGADAKRDEGAARGTKTHSVLETWMRDRTLPPIAEFPADQRGFYQGLAGFLLRHRPQPRYIERVVGSPTYGYAGRLDMRAVLLDGRDAIVDLKTSKRGVVYPEAHLQAAAYAEADEECGADPADGIVIVAVGADGSWEAVDGLATAEDFRSVFGAHKTMSGLRSKVNAQRKELAAAA